MFTHCCPVYIELDEPLIAFSKTLPHKQMTPCKAYSLIYRDGRLIWPIALSHLTDYGDCPRLVFCLHA